MTENARVQLLDRLHQKYDGVSDYLRNLPTIPISQLDGKLISPNEAIREVEHNSPTGQKIIASLM